MIFSNKKIDTRTHKPGSRVLEYSRVLGYRHYAVSNRSSLRCLYATLFSRPQPPHNPGFQTVPLVQMDIERIPGGTRQKDGLETGMMGAAAATLVWAA